MTDLETTLAKIKANLYTESLDTLEIIEESKDDILTYDYDQDREINYHLKPPDRDWIDSLIYITPDIRGEFAAPLGDIDSISNILLQLDPNLLTCLRRIIITTESESDNTAIANEFDIEPDEICNFDDYLGMFWYSQNAVVINMTAITVATKELCAEMHLNKTEAAEEAIIGVYATLIHELRHLSLENPYLDETKYPESEKTEDAVESYCRKICDNLLPQLKRIAWNNCI